MHPGSSAPLDTIRCLHSCTSWWLRWSCQSAVVPTVRCAQWLIPVVHLSFHVHRGCQPTPVQNRIRVFWQCLGSGWSHRPIRQWTRCGPLCPMFCWRWVGVWATSYWRSGTVVSWRCGGVGVLTCGRDWQEWWGSRPGCCTSGCLVCTHHSRCWLHVSHCRLIVVHVRCGLRSVRAPGHPTRAAGWSPTRTDSST